MWVTSVAHATLPQYSSALSQTRRERARLVRVGVDNADNAQATHFVDGELAMDGSAGSDSDHLRTMSYKSHS